MGYHEVVEMYYATKGQVFQISVTFSNSGSKPWTEMTAIGQATEDRLGAQNPQDNATWGFNRVQIDAGETILPGASKTFTFNCTAPNVAGLYNLQWKMLREGVEWFGALSTNVQVTVV